MLQHLAKVDHQLVFREIHHCLTSIVHTDQVQRTQFAAACQIICNMHLLTPFVFCFKSHILFRYYLLRIYREVGVSQDDKISLCY